MDIYEGKEISSTMEQLSNQEFKDLVIKKAVNNFFNALCEATGLKPLYAFVSYVKFNDIDNDDYNVIGKFSHSLYSSIKDDEVNDKLIDTFRPISYDILLDFFKAKAVEVCEECDLELGKEVKVE